VVAPLREVEVHRLLSLKEEAVRLLREAIRARGKNPDAYVVRDVLPKTDLGLATEEWRVSYEAANAWETKVDLNPVPEDKFFVFFGFQSKSASPKTVALRFYKDITPVALFQVENLYAYPEKVGFFMPIVFSESERMRVEFYGSAAGDDLVMLRGLVAELRKKTLA